MNQQTDPQQGSTGTGPRVSGQQMRDVNRLRRSRDDRYIAGVAGGLGRHFDVDPTVIRVLLAVLTLFGGAGVLVYGVVWLFVPEDREDHAPIDLNPDLLKIVLISSAAVALMIVFGTPFFDNDWGWGLPFPLLLLALVGIAVFSTRNRRRGGSTPPPPWGTPPAATTAAPYAGPTEGTTMSSTDAPADASTGTTTTDPGPDPTTAYPRVDPPVDPTSYYRTEDRGGQQPPAWMPPPPPAYTPPPKPRRTGLVLFWPTLALIAIALGTLGIVDVNNEVSPSAYVALALGITALMLVIGAFVGRPGGLIALGIVTSLGLAGASAIEASTDWETGGETRTVTPVSAATVDDTYTVPNGRIALDLTQVRDLAALDGREIDLRLNAGEIDVVLPPGVTAVIDADLSFAGDISIDDAHRGGFDQHVNRTMTSAAANAPTITLDIDARVGEITVQRD